MIATGGITVLQTRQQRLVDLLGRPWTGTVILIIPTPALTLTQALTQAEVPLTLLPTLLPVPEVLMEGALVVQVAAPVDLIVPAVAREAGVDNHFGLN